MNETKHSSGNLDGTVVVGQQQQQQKQTHGAWGEGGGIRVMGDCGYNLLL